MLYEQCNGTDECAEYIGLSEDIAHAVAEAKKYQPDYPWKDNTASEAVWALGQAYLGVKAACADLHAEIARMSRLSDVCPNCGTEGFSQYAGD